GRGGPHGAQALVAGLGPVEDLQAGADVQGRAVRAAEHAGHAHAPVDRDLHGVGHAAVLGEPADVAAAGHAGPDAALLVQADAVRQPGGVGEHAALRQGAVLRTVADGDPVGADLG